ncbi:MAG: hypothetical protein ACP5HM_05090 [Anaerolineae bacterium]
MNASTDMNRREFLKWLVGLGGAAAAGYLLRDLVERRATAPRLTPTVAPTDTPSPEPVPLTATSTPTSEAAPPPTQPPPPTPTEIPWVYPAGVSKLGLHTIKPNNAFPFVRSLAEAGATIALVKAFGGLGLLREIKSVSPATVTIGRAAHTETVGTEGDPAARAQQVMAEHISVWEGERDFVDYWEVLNEPNPAGAEGHVWLARFHIAAMEIAEAHGYKLALFSYPTGVPEWNEWAAVMETGIFARAKAGGHILALHEYDWPTLRDNFGGSIPGQPAYDPDRGVLAVRYRHLYRDFLIPRGEVIPLAITECGLDMGVTGGEMDPYWERRWLKELAWYDSKLVEDDYVLGAAIFTLGGDGGWRNFDYEHLLPQLREYLLAQYRQYG